jgi:hypothetical protein
MKNEVTKQHHKATGESGGTKETRICVCLIFTTFMVISITRMTTGAAFLHSGSTVVC